MPGKRWSPSERRALIRHVRQGKTLADIHIRGRSPAAINNQRQRVREAGLLGNAEKRHLHMWTMRELRALRRYVQALQMSAARIARAGLLPRHSKDSISQQMRRQKLGNPKRREAARLARRLDRTERSALEHFLKTEGRTLSSKELAEKFVISPKTVTAYRRRLNLQLSWHEARSSGRYKQHMERVRRGISRKLRARWQRWRAEQRQKLRHLQWHMERRQLNHPKRACVQCGKAWFATKEFFRVAKRHRRGTVSYTMSRTCRACRAEEKAAEQNQRGM